jgi:excisionase family DNA binding protein
MAETPDGEAYLTTAEAADYLRLKKRTLEEYRIQKKGPAYVKLGETKRSNVLYRKSDLDAWMASQVVKPGAEEL